MKFILKNVSLMLGGFALAAIAAALASAFASKEPKDFYTTVAPFTALGMVGVLMWIVALMNFLAAVYPFLKNGR